MPFMKQISAPLLALSLLATSAAAQGEEEGFSLMEEGAKLFFRGLMSEMEPALRELEDLSAQVEPALRDFVQHMGPALRDLMDEVEDWSAYHPPVILPNGDILLRRKSPSERTPAPGQDEIEL